MQGLLENLGSLFFGNGRKGLLLHHPHLGERHVILEYMLASGTYVATGVRSKNKNLCYKADE